MVGAGEGGRIYGRTTVLYKKRHCSANSLMQFRMWMYIPKLIHIFKLGRMTCKTSSVAFSLEADLSTFLLDLCLTTRGTLLYRHTERVKYNSYYFGIAENQYVGHQSEQIG